jgi:hypothetical protein
MNFGSKINFVIGHNGSKCKKCQTTMVVLFFFDDGLVPGGKSAILTGLTVALGAKANVTNRATNLGALVKAGSKYVLFHTSLVHFSSLIK